MAPKTGPKKVVKTWLRKGTLTAQFAPWYYGVGLRRAPDSHSPARCRIAMHILRLFPQLAGLLDIRVPLTESAPVGLLNPHLTEAVPVGHLSAL